MKNKKIILIAALFIGILITACSKDEVKDTIEEKIIGTMTATIDGTEWKADAPYGSISESRIVITGVGLIGENKKAIILTINGTSLGDFTISYNPLDTAANVGNGATYNADYNNISNENTYLAYRGEISITNITDKKVSGSFSFDCKKASVSDTLGIVVTSGTFSNINYK